MCENTNDLIEDDEVYQSTDTDRIIAASLVAAHRDAQTDKMTVAGVMRLYQDFLDAIESGRLF